ncbi:hypothetical protein [Liquorilactobacillus satsumensis]|uniref:Uncharacterized protein n=1 Tax=Liquorilactobacillus satsumensis DSM 16230 = JCM 12392 TaxID=1423801 RepID=A0A0R1UW70_9LACO|nr:hypothetical protein [Liquorilactobacillus satsumensis]KRL97472.1 hypothetical protein FD50_GL001455 [Liquorilactobacillus satsumensis DSM 16230 = JCM 12392]
MNVKINTPKEMPADFKVLEQRADFIKSRTKYSNGLVLIFEQTAEETTLHSNYNWIQEADGSLTPNYNSQNSNFIDVV